MRTGSKEGSDRRSGNALKRILLACDLTAGTDRATDRAFMLARANQSKLTVLHVIDASLLPARFARRDLREAKVRMERELAQAGPKGLGDVEVQVAMGDPARAIAEHAAAAKSDLAVLGAGQYGTLTAAFRGTTVDQAIRAAGCPVLTVKTRPRGAYRSVVVAFDRGEASARALAFALSAFPKARFTVVHVHEGGETRSEVKLSLAQALKACGASDAVKTIVKQGAALDALQAEIDRVGPDLLVAGTHGRRGASKFFLGSVAESLVAGATCDVLVARA